MYYSDESEFPEQFISFEKPKQLSEQRQLERSVEEDNITLGSIRSLQRLNGLCQKIADKLSSDERLKSLSAKLLEKGATFDSYVLDAEEEDEKRLALNSLFSKIEEANGIRRTVGNHSKSIYTDPHGGYGTAINKLVALGILEDPPVFETISSPKKNDYIDYDNPQVFTCHFFISTSNEDGSVIHKECLVRINRHPDFEKARTIIEADLYSHQKQLNQYIEKYGEIVAKPINTNTKNPRVIYATKMKSNA